MFFPIKKSFENITFMINLKQLLSPLFGLTIASASQAQNDSIDDKPHLFAVPTQNASPLWGAINSDGSLVIEPIYKKLNEFEDDASLPSPVQAVNGKWGYINRQGELVHPINLDTARSFSEERLARFKKNKQWGFIKPNGEYAIEPIYDQASYFFNGYAIVTIDQGWSAIDTTGKPLFDHRFERLGVFSPAGLAVAREDNDSAYGYIDIKGNWVIKAQFDYATGFGKANRASVEKDEKWGIIDEKGNWVVKPTYPKMDEFGDEDFTAFYTDWDKGGLIDANGQIIFDHREKRFYEPRHDTQCNIVITEYSKHKFYNLNGKPLEQLNSGNYPLISGFDSECTSLALTGDDNQWTQLKSDGSRNDLPSEVQEPYFSWDGESTEIALASGDFIPVILKDRSVAYLNRNNEIALRASTEASSQGDTLVVSDPNGKEIWRHSYDNNTLVENNKHHFFLTKGELEFAYEKPSKENISAKIELLKKKPPAPFETSYGEDLDSGEGDSFGAGIRIAHATYAQYDHASRYHYAIDWPDFTPQFNEVKSIIESLLGSEVEDNETIENVLDENSIYGHNQASWLIDDSILVLHDTYYEDGDVDYWASLNLVLLPTKEAKSSLTSLETSEAEALNFSDKSAASVSVAATELRDNFRYNSAEGLRRLAVNVIDIAQSGDAISPDDYIWAQYGQLVAAYYDGAEEIQVGTVEEYVDVASETLDFLDNNGVGADLLTAEGQTRLTIYRYAANGAAWALRESDPEHALKLIERALDYARPEDAYLYHTQAQALLNLDRQDDAFLVVKKALDENPWDEDFNEFTENSDYEKWIKKQGGKFTAYDDIPTTSKHLSENQTIAVNLESNKLAVYWNDELHMFDLQSGEAIFSVNTDTYQPFSMAFNHDGSQLLSSGWDEVAIWDTSSGKNSSKNSGKKIVSIKNEETNSQCAGFSSKEKHYFYETEVFASNTLTVSDFTGRSLLKLAMGHNCNTSDDNRLLAVNGLSDDGREQIQVIDLEKHKVATTLVGEKASPYDNDLFFVQDNEKLLVRDFSNFHLWDIKESRVDKTWTTDSLDVDEVTATNDFIFVLDADQWVARLWRFGEEPGKNISLPIPDYANGSENYRGFKVNKAQTQYVVATKNKEENLRYIFVFDFNSHEIIKEFVFAEDFAELFFTQDDQHLVLDSYPIQILDLKSGEIVQRISRPQ